MSLFVMYAARCIPTSGTEVYDSKRSSPRDVLLRVTCRRGHNTVAVLQVRLTIVIDAQNTLPRSGGRGLQSCNISVYAFLTKQTGLYSE